MVDENYRLSATHRTIKTSVVIIDVIVMETLVLTHAFLKVTARRVDYRRDSSAIKASILLTYRCITNIRNRQRPRERAHVYVNSLEIPLLFPTSRLYSAAVP